MTEALDGHIKDLRTALRRIRRIAHQAPCESPDAEARTLVEICTEALGDKGDRGTLAYGSCLVEGRQVHDPRG